MIRTVSSCIYDIDHLFNCMIVWDCECNPSKF